MFGVDLKRRGALGLVILIFVLLVPGAATADCAPPNFDRDVQKAHNVIIGEVMVVGPRKGENDGKTKASHQIKAVKILKDGGLVKKGARFQFPTQTMWGDPFDFKKGQLIMFFFRDTIGVKCSFPITIQ